MDHKFSAYLSISSQLFEQGRPRSAEYLDTHCVVIRSDRPVQQGMEILLCAVLFKKRKEN